MILNEDAIRKAISASVYRAIGEGAVASVDVDFPDDEPMKDVVNVRICVNGEVDRSALSGLLLTLRKILIEYEDDLFPLISMISQGEFSRSHR